MLPAAASIRKQGASRGATTAFLISTPESGVDSISVTYALLDPIMTVVRPVAAFCTALAAGLLENILEFEKPSGTPPGDACPIDGCCDEPDCPPERRRKHHSRLDALRAGLRFAVVDVWGDIVLWFFAGLLLAGCISVLIPDDLMVEWLGGGVSSMLIMLLFGIPLYICATASTPIAAALILKGVSPGAALVFLLVGPATNITSLSVLIGILGRKTTARYLLVLAAMAVLFGLGIDALYTALAISPKVLIGSAGELVPAWLQWLSAMILLVLSLRPVYLFARSRLAGRKRGGRTFHSDFPPVIHPKKQ